MKKIILIIFLIFGNLGYSYAKQFSNEKFCFTHESGECLTHCPENTFPDNNGICWPCDTAYSHYISSYPTFIEECLKCPNRIYKDGDCILQSCPEGTFKSDRRCVPCDDEYPRSFVEETECLKCSNREIVKDGKWTYCASKCEGKCRSANGLDCYECGDCFYPSPYVVSEEECSKCPNRRMENGLCIPKTKCPQGTSLSPFMDACVENTIL